jgi:capsular polysaccharide transport system ATP-binding protein
MIEIRSLYKRYHHYMHQDWVLEDINLTIPKGVSVGLVGQNGAGKSTLLRLIAGMDSPERGSIRRHCRVSWPIGLGGGLQGSMTGRQNAQFIARIHGGRKVEQRILDFVEDFAEIGSAFERPVSTYSSGMRSRLAFGLSLAFDFDVYLSDEATSVGDRAFKAKAKKAFRDRVGRASLIMVSHGEAMLRDLCEAGIFLHEGSAHWYDDIDEAIAAYHDVNGTPDPQPLVEARKELKKARGEVRAAKVALQEAREKQADEVATGALKKLIGERRQVIKQQRAIIAALKENVDDDD